MSEIEKVYSNSWEIHREAPWQVLIGPGRGSVFQNRCKKCAPLTTGACSGCEFRGLKKSTPKQGGK